MRRRCLAISCFVALKDRSSRGLVFIRLMLCWSMPTIDVEGVAVLCSLLLLQFYGLTWVVDSRLVALLQEILLSGLRWLLGMTLPALLLLLLHFVLLILISFVKFI